MTAADGIHFTNPPHPYWLASTPTTDYPALTDDTTVDVAIIGGGIVGITCAYMLKAAGMRVAIVEADAIVQGATGHTTAKITSQHQLIYSKIEQAMGRELAQQYADANEGAIQKIEELIITKGIDCDFSKQKAYIYTQRDGYIEKLEEEAKLAKQLGIKATVVSSIDLPVKVKAALCFDDQAQFHPRKYLLALAKDIPGDGSHIFEQTRVVDIEEGKHYQLKTAAGKKVTAKKVILASQYPCYNKAGLYFSRIYTDRSYAVAVKAKDVYPGGMYITAEEPARSFRCAPTDDGELIIVGGEHHKTGQGIDTRQHYQTLAVYAQQIFQIEDIPYRWSTQDCMTLDGIPYVGHFLPSTRNLYIITGFGKWGMTNSMASAMIIHDLIVQGESPWQDVYNPSRNTVAASAKTFVVENLNVAKEFVGGKLSAVPDSIDINPGEGRIIAVDGEKAGAYRDEAGVLHVVDITCTHLGCELAWNAAERSWDCPCHGSRFTYTGDIITGPTVKPLEKLNNNKKN